MNRDDLDRREHAFREALRERRAGVLPDASFSARVLQRLPAAPEWTLDWAARRVLPASLGLAVVLAGAAFVSHERVASSVLTSSKAGSSAAASAPASSSRGGESDPLEWVLQGSAVTE
jgi:hypothetical protein